MGGGGGGDPGAEARRQEEERQRRIQAATDEINGIFSGQQKVARTRTVTTPGSRKKTGGRDFIDTKPVTSEETYYEWVPNPGAVSRQSLYDNQRNAVFDLNKKSVEQQGQDMERINRFGLARAGLMGGSAEIDSNAELNRRTNEGLMRARGIADGAAADLQLADERTRSGLISMAQSGIDTGTAASLALEGLRNNADNAAAARGGSTVGALFDDLGYAYLYNQGAQGRAAGNQAYQQQWTGVSNPRTGDSGTVSR